jgi:acyl carrier protein
MQDLHARVLMAVKSVRSDIEDCLTTTHLVLDGVLDSLDLMNIIVAFEDSFQIEVEPEDVLFDNFASIETMTEMVSKYLK